MELFATIPGYYLLLMGSLKLGLAGSTLLVTAPYRLILVAYFVSGILKGQAYRFSILRAQSLYAVALLIFWCLYFARIAGDAWFSERLLSRAASEYLLYAIGFCIIPSLYFSIPKSLEWTRDTGRYLAWGCALISILAYLLYSEVFQESSGRLRGLESDMESTLGPLAVSYTAALAATLSVSNFNGSDPKRWLSGCLIALGSVPGLLMGASRGSIAAMVASLLIYLIFRPGFAANLRVLLFSFLAAILYVLIFADLDSVLFERLFATVGRDEEELRALLWRDAVLDIVSSPILGASLEVQSFARHPHNIIIEAFLATGIIGGSIFLAVMVIAWLDCLRLFQRGSFDSHWIGLLFLVAFFQYMVSGAIWGSAWLWPAILMLRANSYASKA